MDKKQEKSPQEVDVIIIPGFGERFLEAFGGASYREIAKQIGVGKSAVGNYANDRVPKIRVLLKISELTRYSLHWLILGEGPKRIADSQDLDKVESGAIRQFLMEQLICISNQDRVEPMKQKKIKTESL